MSLRAALIGTDKIYTLLLRRLVFIFLLVMFLTTLAATFMRYIPSLPGLVWAEEVTRYTSIWMIFVASAIGIRRGIHLGVDVVVVIMPPGIQRIVRIGNLLLILLFEIVLIYFGSIMAISNMDQMSSALEMPMGLAFLAIPVGGLLMAYETGRELFLCLRPARAEP